jgi:hypothetical protein
MIAVFGWGKRIFLVAGRAMVNFGRSPWRKTKDEQVGRFFLVDQKN